MCPDSVAVRLPAKYLLPRAIALGDPEQLSVDTDHLRHDDHLQISLSEKSSPYVAAMKAFVERDQHVASISAVCGDLLVRHPCMADGGHTVLLELRYVENVDKG